MSIVLVKIHAQPNDWFCNLRLLQICDKLKVPIMICIKTKWGSHPMGWIVSKIDAFETIVGDTKTKEFKTPPFKMTSA